MKTIILNSPLQGFLLKQAVNNEIKAYLKKGFTHKDFEVQQLKNVIPKI